jgi:uncharacterized protein DUF4242
VTARRMATFIVESYGAAGSVGEHRARARLVAELGTGVRYIRTTFLPGDETLLHVFEAASAEAVRRAALTASLPCDRIVEAVEGEGEP